MDLDLSHPFLTRGLIAYLGNKRRLLSVISRVFDELEAISPIHTMLDPFTGSGAVARLGKLRGYRVHANDWEPFAHIVCAAHLVASPELVHTLFGASDIGAVMDELNTIGAGGADGVVSHLYAPKSTDGADHHTERLFYTHENARFLDAVRLEIEDRYPGWDLSADRQIEKTLLLSSLVYEASTHANTSGVFKAFHKGFGGYGADALTRILADARLEVPSLIPGTGCTVGCEDGASFAARHPVDLCYLDPPYNQHQYGSNYHLLNTIALGDTPPLAAGEAKAGIRTDWVKTRSRFCSRRSASHAFSELLDSIDSRFIVMSYNTSGTCDIEELYDLLSARGSVRLHAADYVTYRGGRQSPTRSIHNPEILFLVDTRRRAPARGADEIRRVLLEREVATLLRHPLHPDRVKQHFDCSAGMVELVPGSRTGTGLAVHDLCLRRTERYTETLKGFSDAGLSDLRTRLEACCFDDRDEEVDTLLRLLEDGMPDRLRRRAVAQLFDSLKKIAFRKYRRRFEQVLDRVREACERNPAGFPGAGRALEELTTIADRRFQR